MVGERGFEPPTPWSRTLNVKTLSGFVVSLRDKKPFFLLINRTETVPRAFGTLLQELRLASISRGMSSSYFRLYLFCHGIRNSGA